MSNSDRGHRPNGDFMTDEEMEKERQRKLFIVVSAALFVLLLGSQGYLPV